MKASIVLIALVWSGAALAQSASPFPPVPGAASPPAAAAQPAKPKPKAAAKKKAAPAQPSVLSKLESCATHDDGTKERLDCYDAVVKPQPKPKPGKAKAANDCRFLKEEDERLTCYNGFADKSPRPASLPPPSAEPSSTE